MPQDKKHVGRPPIDAEHPEKEMIAKERKNKLTEISNRLKSVIENRKLSYADVVRKMFISDVRLEYKDTENMSKDLISDSCCSYLDPQAVYKWATGKTAIPINMISRLTKALECDAGYLCGEYEAYTWQTQKLGNYTGLSHKAIYKLKKYGENPGSESISMGEISKLILNDEFILLLEAIDNYRVSCSNTNDLKTKLELSKHRHDQNAEAIASDYIKKYRETKIDRYLVQEQLMRLLDTFSKDLKKPTEDDSKLANQFECFGDLTDIES